MTEWKWFDIEGYTGKLEVSDDGRIRRSSYTYEMIGRWGGVVVSTKPDKELCPFLAKNGYKVISLRVGKGRPKFSVHRLVATAFVPGYFEDATVNHINGIKTDNRARNLEWVSLGENTALQWRDGLVDLRGERHPSSKLTDEKVRLIRRLLKEGTKKSHIARRMGICHAMVLKIERREAWAHVD